jgi:hypothetical protein
MEHGVLTLDLELVANLSSVFQSKRMQAMGNKSACVLFQLNPRKFQHFFM